MNSITYTGVLLCPVSITKLFCILPQWYYAYELELVKKVDFCFIYAANGDAEGYVSNII